LRGFEPQQLKPSPKEGRLVIAQEHKADLCHVEQALKRFEAAVTYFAAVTQIWIVYVAKTMKY